MQTSSNNRNAPRFGVALPITMEGEEASTHDISAGGFLIESATAPEIGTQVDLTLEYLMDGHDFTLPCKGEVVRVERHGENYNIAVRLTKPLFSTDDE